MSDVWKSKYANKATRLILFLTFTTSRTCIIISSHLLKRNLIVAWHVSFFITCLWPFDKSHSRLSSWSDKILDLLKLLITQTATVKSPENKNIGQPEIITFRKWARNSLKAIKFSTQIHLRSGRNVKPFKIWRLRFLIDKSVRFFKLPDGCSTSFKAPSSDLYGKKGKKDELFVK